MPGSRRRYLPILVSFFLASLFAFALIASAQPPQNEKKSSPVRQSRTYERPSDPSLYVGAEVCKTCHEDMPSKGFFKSYEDSPHYVTTLDTKKGPEWHGCEACHGPGKAHVDGGGDKT